MSYLRFCIKDQTLRRQTDLSDFSGQLSDMLNGAFGNEVHELRVERDYISFLTNDSHPAKADGISFEINRCLSGAPLPGELTAVPGSFIAGFHGYVTEASFPYRPGIKFELVSLSDLEPFLFSDDYGYHNIHKEPIKHVYETFLKNGIDSEAFLQAKCHYLGNLHIDYLEVYFDDPEYVLFPMNSWYYVTLTGEVDASILPFIAPEVPFNHDLPRDCIYMTQQNLDDFTRYYLDVNKASCLITLLNDDMQQRLFALSSLTEINAQNLSNENAILQNTAFSRACVFDMGQALCVGLYSSLPPSQSGQPQFALNGFFDFGLPHISGRPHPNYARDYNRVFRQFVHTCIQPRRMVDIILSHWHYDHYLLAVPLQNYLGSTRWFAPNSRISAFMPQTALNLIEDHNGTLTYALPIQVSVPFHGNPNLLVSKMDYVPEGNHPDHIHHHSLYAQLHLSSGTDVFLAGDCTYAGINNNARTGFTPNSGYHYLQASHHGGDYSLPPATADSNDIPLPVAAGNPQVIYSCNRAHNHLGHPLQNSVNDHDTRGWSANNCHITEHNGSLVIR